MYRLSIAILNPVPAGYRGGVASPRVGSRGGPVAVSLRVLHSCGVSSKYGGWRCTGAGPGGVGVVVPGAKRLSWDGGAAAVPGRKRVNKNEVLTGSRLQRGGSK